MTVNNYNDKAKGKDAWKWEMPRAELDKSREKARDNENTGLVGGIGSGR